MPMVNKKTVAVNKYANEFDVYIGRGSVFGNSYTHKANTLAEFQVDSRDEAISKHKEALLKDPALMKRVRRELSGKVLGCFCKPKACHGDTYSWLCNMSKLNFKMLLKKALAAKAMEKL